MWVNKITQEETKGIVFALAATKQDIGEESWAVSRAEIESFVNKYNIDIFVETSAKNNYNVEELFQEIVETIVSRFDIK